MCSSNDDINDINDVLAALKETEGAEAELPLRRVPVVPQEVRLVRRWHGVVRHLPSQLARPVVRGTKTTASANVRWPGSGPLAAAVCHVCMHVHLHARYMCICMHVSCDALRRTRVATRGRSNVRINSCLGLVVCWRVVPAWSCKEAEPTPTIHLGCANYRRCDRNHRSFLHRNSTAALARNLSVVGRTRKCGKSHTKEDQIKSRCPVSQRAVTSVNWH